MRNLKKFLALVLAMVMAMSLMITVSAATFSTDVNKEHAGTTYSDEKEVTAEFKEAVAVLTGMGVFQGENTEFYAARNVTRAEVAELLYRLVSGDVAGAKEDLYKNYGNFPDVTEDKWYAGAVGYCANAGLIKGRPDGRFDPAGNVTGYEVLAMILRAVGYDKNGEFTGSDWQVNVSSLSQQLGVLRNVNSTQYGATLYGPSRRDVVADLLFQCVATIPQVNYTTAFGYQQFGNVGGVTGSVKNDSLGYKVFGLTANKGIVVGNEVTGEAKGVTKIGFSLNTRRTNEMINVDQFQSNIVTGYNNSTASFYTVINDQVSIAEPNGAYAYLYAPVNRDGLPMNVTRAFKWDTDLTQFNHAVKVWYDNRSSKYVTVGAARGTEANENEPVANYGTAQFTTDLTTYAVFDEVEKTSVVALNEDILKDAANNVYIDNDADLDGDLGAAVTSTVASVENDWDAPAMTLRQDYYRDIDADDHSVAFFNYAFGPIASYNFGSIAEGTGDELDAFSAKSPVMKNGNGKDDADEQLEAPEKEYGLYLLISNDKNDRTLDVVIPLEMTFSKITQQNDTNSPKTIGVMNGNDRSPGTTVSDSKYFDVVDTVKSSNGTEYAEIWQDNLRNTPATRLEEHVAAIAITGTAGSKATVRNRGVEQWVYNTSAGAYGTDYNSADEIEAGEPDYGFANPGGDDYARRVNENNGIEMTSQYYYQVTETNTTKTAKVIYIDPETQTLTLSDNTKLYQSVFAESVDGTFTNNIEGVDKDNTNQGQKYQQVLELNRDYTFTLDQHGHYIYWETPRDTGSFIYATYIDFETKTASSTFRYPVVYVDANGTAKQMVDAMSIKDLADLNMTYQSLSAVRYDEIILPKRDHNPNDNDNTVGNDAGYRQGYYLGYKLEGNTLTAIDELHTNDPYMTASWDNDLNTTFYKGSENDFGFEDVVIDATDSKIGAQRIATENPNLELFLTETTKFYVVTGAGTDNQSVTTYTGVTELLDGATAVHIDVTDTTSPLKDATRYLRGTDDYANGQIDPWDELYYQLDLEKYAQDYLGSALYVKSVFIPAPAVTWDRSEAGSSTYFVGDNTQLYISSINGNDITCFRFYDSTGAAQDLWVNGHVTDGTSSAAIIAQLGENVFYNLVSSGTATADGKTIYNIRNVAENISTVIGEIYRGYDADTKTYDNTTIMVGTTDNNSKPVLYAPTTRGAQVAYIDDIASWGTQTDRRLIRVEDAKVVNLDQAKYPGVTADRVTLDDAGSLLDNDGIPVSCFKNDRSATIIFINAPETSTTLGE